MTEPKKKTIPPDVAACAAYQADFEKRMARIKENCPRRLARIDADEDNANDWNE